MTCWSAVHDGRYTLIFQHSEDQANKTSWLKHFILKCICLKWIMLPDLLISMYQKIRFLFFFKCYMLQCLFFIFLRIGIDSLSFFCQIRWRIFRCFTLWTDAWHKEHAIVSVACSLLITTVDINVKTAFICTSSPFIMFSLQHNTVSVFIEIPINGIDFFA